ncbi:MAG: integrin alpha, partial [Planctomycetota bacterium]
GAQDRIRISIFRLGSLYWFEWAFFANGALIDSDFGTTESSTSTLTIQYNSTWDQLTAFSNEAVDDDPVAVGVGNVVGTSGVGALRLFMGGYVDGITIDVESGEAFYDEVRVEGCIVEPETITPVQHLDARADSSWFRRGDSAGDRFGWSCRYAGDVDQDGVVDVVIGAPRDGTAANNAGKAAVYSGATGTVIFEQHGAGSGTQLGYAVDGAGDWNQDGHDDIVVGAPFADGPPGDNVGAVFVYSGEAPHPLLWSRFGEAADDRFGSDVAGLGDVNGDGYGDVVVGAPRNDAAGSNAGRVYVFLGNGGQLWKRKKGQASGDQFGRVVAAAGDVNGDGDADFLVGAPFHDAGGTNAGKVYVYSGNSGARLFARRGANGGDRLGWSGAGAGDVDGDGLDDVIVGAINDDAGGTNAGAALLLSGDGGSTLRKFVGAAGGDRLGWSVATAGDVNGDGTPDLVVGAPRRDAAGTNTGRVVIFSGVDGAVLVTIDGELSGDQLGTSVDGDALPGVLVGTWRAGTLQRQGTAYRYDFE